VWDSVNSDFVALFTASDGQCTEAARGAIRLGFHDAGAWSLTSGFGGADGSLLISTEEITRSENNGLQEIIATYQVLWAKYKPFGVGAADLIQFGATVAAVVCPLGPRGRVFLGRKDGDGSSPTGLLPDVNSDADTLIDLFADKTISASDLAALIGAHSTSEQDVVDPALAGAPQDSTPGVNDILFYSETIDPNAPAEVFKFPSDVALAADSRIAPSFTFFGSNPAGQAAWNDAFARAYIRLSILGVPNIDDMFECSRKSY
jgi:manganese peroxidase